MAKAELSGSLTLEDRISSLIRLGGKLKEELSLYRAEQHTGLSRLIEAARAANPWFTGESIVTALNYWSEALQAQAVSTWLSPYLSELKKDPGPVTVGVVNAGNIPFVGFHDLISVILCGYSYQGKNATGDSYLLPYLANTWVELEPLLTDKIRFVSRLEAIDAVIATGNNNSARYFEYYFGKYPHLIRMNRNGVAVLSGNETAAELQLLGKDIFTYFGLGCRNVSKLYVPRGYDFDFLFQALFDFNGIMMHAKYMNNFDYNNSVLLLKRIPFLQNGFLIVRAEEQIASPVSVLHYEYYDDIISLQKKLERDNHLIQCIVVRDENQWNAEELKSSVVRFGATQAPALWDYADGVDTIKFLCGISRK